VAFEFAFADAVHGFHDTLFLQQIGIPGAGASFAHFGRVHGRDGAARPTVMASSGFASSEAMAAAAGQIESDPGCQKAHAELENGAQPP